jgi:hypothetical protein
MTKIGHPFAKVCRAVFKEKYPDKEAAIPDDSPLAANGIPEDVIDEALKRYYAGQELVIHTPFLVKSADIAQKQEVKRTITYA